MPSLQVVDLSPKERTETTPLEKTLSGFSKRNRENQLQQEESDALKAIYEPYQQDAKNLDSAIIAAQTRPGLSPTARVNTVNQLMQFKKYNSELQNNQKIISDLEKKRGLQPGELSAYINDPKMAEQISRPARGTQASQPINDDQLRRIQQVEDREDFKDASLADKAKMLRNAGVSKENNESVLKPYTEEAKLPQERQKIITQKQAAGDVEFVAEQTAAIPQLQAQQRTLDEAKQVIDQNGSGKAWDSAMQRAGLVQYTSDGYRVLTSIAKDAVRNQNIKAVVGSQMSQREFQFFVDATINPNFTAEANRQIIKKEGLSLRYKKLYADITKQIVEQNGGEIPVNIQQQVNDEFNKQSEKISKEVREAAIDYDAIQNVPPGYVLMYDKKRRPLHAPANEVEKYSKLGATLS